GVARCGGASTTWSYRIGYSDTRVTRYTVCTGPGRTEAPFLPHFVRIRGLDHTRRRCRVSVACRPTLVAHPNRPRTRVTLL
ncbi:hypothetical protein J6590_042497, partial [Homalodisca vitripennis]